MKKKKKLQILKLNMNKLINRLLKIKKSLNKKLSLATLTKEKEIIE